MALVPKFPKKKFQPTGNFCALTFWPDEQLRNEKRPGFAGAFISIGSD
jgi:hypothetical protein